MRPRRVEQQVAARYCEDGAADLSTASSWVVVGEPLSPVGVA
jgi:hypothetical protein